MFKSKKYKANGAIQLDPLSTNAKIDSPEIGLIRAAEKAQITAHRTTYLTGLIRIVKATKISIIPIMGINCSACSNENPTVSRYFNYLALPFIATRP